MADWLLKEWEQRGKEIAALESRVRELEAENARLQEELQELKYELKEERN